MMTREYKSVDEMVEALGGEKIDESRTLLNFSGQFTYGGEIIYKESAQVSLTLLYCLQAQHMSLGSKSMGAHVPRMTPIRFTRPIGSYKQNDVATVQLELAKSLIDNGFAMSYNGPPPKTKEATYDPWSDYWLPKIEAECAQLSWLKRLWLRVTRWL